VGVLGVAFLQRDNLHLKAHINKRGNLIEDEGF